MAYKNPADKAKYNMKYSSSHKTEKQIYDLKRRIARGQKKQSILTQHIKLK